MSNARANILGRLRAPQRPVVDTTGRHDLSRHDWDTTERVRRFTERMQMVRGEVHHAGKAGWLDTVSAICAAKGLRNLLVARETEWGRAICNQAASFPPLLHYDRSIEDWKGDLFHNTAAAVTGTLGGIAETGTLILWPDALEPRLMSLVPPVHIALLDTDKLFTTFAEAILEQGWIEAGMPTNALLVSGPSKSADIEQTLAYGVHGPKELIVVLV